ncbi:MAG: hypothetical protein HY866_01340 [Chloroflexi bacterium]|nr:hypothetical protein [Chloroflexota bacterium]
MPATKTVRRSVAMTPQMRQRLQQLLDKQEREITEADLIRQAIHEFLDRQGDFISSRAHFTKTFQGRIDDLQADLTFHLDMLLVLLAYGLEIILPVFTEKPVTAVDLITTAIQVAQREHDAIHDLIQAARGTQE